MFSIQEKQHIARELEKILLDLKHPEMPTEKPYFTLHIDGKKDWSWADIKPNWSYEGKSIPYNVWNEVARDVIPGGNNAKETRSSS